jgi:hypothetical protein
LVLISTLVIGLMDQPRNIAMVEEAPVPSALTTTIKVRIALSDHDGWGQQLNVTATARSILFINSFEATIKVTPP